MDDDHTHPLGDRTPATGTTDDLAALRAELAALRAELQALRPAANAPATPAGTAPVGSLPASSERVPREASSRRQVIRRMGLAVGGAVVGATAVAGEAAAAPASITGDPITAGQVNICTNTTELKMPDNTGAGVNLFSHVFVAQDGVWSSSPTFRVPYTEPANDTETGSAAVAGFAGSVAMHGGYFQTNSGLRNGSGVRAVGASAGSYGLMVSGRRAAIRILRLPLQIPPSSRADAHNEGEILIDDNRDLWYCHTSSTPGSWLKLSGPTTAGQFHPITPARVYDSRFTPAVSAGVGPIAPGEERVVSVADAFAVSSATVATPNVVPAGATAIAYNLTIADTGPSGYLAVSPGDATSITASTINWFQAGTVLANGTVVKLDGSRRIKVFCVGSATHVIIDVAGYYR